MFRRDKTSLSGRLRRFAFGVLKHRPRSGVRRIIARGAARVSRQAQGTAADTQKPPVGGFVQGLQGQAASVERLARGVVRVVVRAGLAVASVLACQPLAVSLRVTVKRSDSFKAVTMFLTCSCPLVWAV